MDSAFQYRHQKDYRKLSSNESDYLRRFGGITRLYGQAGLNKLRQAHICIIGIGGVGSWSAEAIARHGVGEITLIDLDMVAESNTNRQIHALGDIYGKAKVVAMAERITAINPECKINCVEDFITPENVAELLSADYSVVIDAIDQLKAKVAIAAHCQRNGIPLVISGAAGGQTDPTRIRVADLSKTEQDPILSKLRSTLRKHHGFPRDGKKMGITAVYSTEPLRYPAQDTSCDLNARTPQGLNCAGFGSSICVTSVFGMVAACQAVRLLTSDEAH